MSTNSHSGSSAAQPEKIVVTDPHVEDTGLSESEVTRIRTLQGFWRWALIILTLATILLCMNQQFAWRFFIGYTQLNTEYFYLLIALMLPFTFLIFPGWSKAPLDRIPWYDIALFVITFGIAIYLMAHIRAAAANGWEFGGAPKGVIYAGLVMWAVLMEALRRSGGWSLLLSVFPFTVYPLFADEKWLGPFRGTQSDLDIVTSYHVLSGESLLGIPLQAFADTVIGFLVFGTALMMTGAGKFFINLVVRPVRHLPRRRRQGLRVCQRAARHRRRQHRLQRADRRHDDDPDHEADRLYGLLCRRDRGLCFDRRRARAAGAGRNRVRDGAVHERQLRRSRARRDAALGPVLRGPVHAGRCVRRTQQAEGPPARGAAAPVGRLQGRLVLPVRDRDPGGHAAPLQAREPRPVLRHRPARHPASVVGTGPLEARQHRRAGVLDRSRPR